MDSGLLENERIDDLQYKGLRLIQKRDGFCFGVDAVLLSDFAQVAKKDVVLDMGTGTGVVALLLAAKKEPRRVVGLEILPEMADMAARSAKMNGMGGRVEIVNGDLKEAVSLFGASSFDAVVTNPPYMGKGNGLLNAADAKTAARHEILCSLEDVISAAAKLLKPGGRFSMVHRPQRLADIIYLMRVYALEPKLLRFVHPSPGKRPNLLLISGSRNGNPELRVREPLYIYDENGQYTGEIDEIYNKPHKQADIIHT